VVKWSLRNSYLYSRQIKSSFIGNLKGEVMDKVQVLVFAKDGVVQNVQASLGKKDIDVSIDMDDVLYACDLT
jgi:hypothetical protein